MALRLHCSAPDFEDRFRHFLANKREVTEDVDAVVRDIISDVRARGDKALIELSQRLDNVDLTDLGMRFTEDEIASASQAVPGVTREALKVAHQRIRDHHEHQRPTDINYTDDIGVTFGQRWTPVEAAGLYVPGGTASYPSSVLMNAVPAKVAGVERLVMVVPTPGGEINPLVLAAAELAGIDEIYRLGGAQAIAALAYGTETLRPVAKIVGPGNAYVAAAKRQVFGTVGIDMVAGPSEVLIIADRDNDPDIIAADLLAQAEHDVAAQSILMTDDGAFADTVEAAVQRQLETLPRGGIARQSWEDFGAVILLDNLDQSPPIANRIAAEHLEIATPDARALGQKINNAGAIFLGHNTPEVIGDYVGGTNHVLPTARSARFSSGLGVLDFMKRTSILELDQAALEVLAPSAITLAEAEGLTGHARSVARRLGTQALPSDRPKING